ncbi:InlB B-repeat-containing protein [Cerasicoccus maritimus]|uniref:InlB B-repeat-containing protein n=1 Tax=Cerasicoccus maritimus TaxID=490089 RepID=UPI0028525D83|nr:hypothetical protein [Cerasicoccus maritimus]
MKLFLSILILFCTITFVQSAYGEEEPDEHPGYRLNVKNGEGSGYYDEGDSVSVTATVPSGYQFIKWVKDDGEGTIDNLYDSSTSFTMPAKTIKLTAIAAKIESWFSVVSGDESIDTWLLLPKPGVGQTATRFPHTVRVSVDTGGGMATDKAFKNILVRIGWFPSSSAQGYWHSNDLLTYWSASSGGTSIAKDSFVSRSSFQAKGGGVFEATVWYEGDWSPKDPATLPAGATYVPPEAEAGFKLIASGPNYYKQVSSVSLFLKPVDLDAMKVSHNVATDELADYYEETEGAFLPVNNDDDDYDPSNTPDKDQTGAIARESGVGDTDLLQVKLQAVGIAGGKYKLDIPSIVKVWKKDDRTEEVVASTEFDATVETRLYVEGISKGSDEIKAIWVKDSFSLSEADKIRVTVFEWDGPLNVPGYSIHQYTASGALTGSKWLTPIDGTIQAGDDSSDVRILWGEGAAVGKAVYEVNQNYLWDLEVNIVKVEIAKKFIIASGVPKELGVNGSRLYFAAGNIASGQRGLMWDAEITLTGPLSHRGVRRIQVGFVQNVNVTQTRGVYITEAKRLVMSMEGLTYLDGDPSGTVPWYADGSTNAFLSPTESLRIKTIFGEDTPIQFVPIVFDQGNVVDATDDVVDSLAIVLDFDLHVAARTIDTQNKADEIYTSRARLDWSVNITGNVDQNAPYSLSPSPVKNPAHSDWTPVVDGSTPDVVKPPFANDRATTTVFIERPI